MADIKIADIILDFIYPCRCIMCGRVMRIEGEIKICPECEKTSKRINPPFCEKCGRHIDGGNACLCGECGGRGFAFDRGGALWPYEGKMARSVLDLKFNRRLGNGKTLGILCAENILEKKLSDNIDVILPVPLHKNKLSKRGYNQAEIVAETIGKRLHIPVESDLLFRVKNTVPQMELNYERRVSNIKDSMKAAPQEKIAGRSILLIDDIFTTGSTLAECAAKLKQNGAGLVNCYCICISYGRMRS